MNPMRVATNCLGSEASYSWEVSAPNEFGEYSPYVKLTESVVFAPSNQSILDSAYFQPRFRVRCLAQLLASTTSTNEAHLTLQSRAVQVVAQESNCAHKWVGGGTAIKPYASNGEPRFTAGLTFDRRPFSASADYVSADFITSNSDIDAEFLNLIRLSVEVAYVEGSVPLVSTLPLQNYRQLLTDPSYAQHHPCSNLAKKNSAKSVPFFHGPLANLRDNRTLQFYSHLNRAACKWIFVAFYDISELTTHCQAQIASDAEIRDEHSDRNFLSIKIPVHVAHVFPGAQATWSSVEYQALVDASITYRSSALQETELSRIELADYLSPPHEQLLSLVVDKITLNHEGRLIIEFTTIPSFRGFVSLQFYLPLIIFVKILSFRSIRQIAPDQR